MKLLNALVGELARLKLGTPGKDLFHSFMPAQIKTGTLVLTRVAINVDRYTSQQKGPFQVICRGPTPEAVHGKASEIAKALKRERAVVGEVSFQFICPEHEPFVYPRTEGGQYEASVNYSFVASWEN